MRLSITIIDVYNKYTDFEIHDNKTFFPYKNKTPIEKWAFCHILRALAAVFFQHHILKYLAGNFKIWYNFIDASVSMNHGKRIDIACYLQRVKYEEKM